MELASSVGKRMRWRPILCLWGLVLFGLLTYGSMRMNEMLQQHGLSRYFWWGSIRLDSDPLNKRPVSKPCVKEEQDCAGDTLYVQVTPGWIERALILSALPAFLLAIAAVRGLAHLGVSELLSFMFTMPLLTLAWFYTVGWLLDRWQYKRSLNRPSTGP